MHVSKKHQIITGALMTTGMAFGCPVLLRDPYGLHARSARHLGNQFPPRLASGFAALASIVGRVRRIAARLVRS